MEKNRLSGIALIAVILAASPLASAGGDKSGSTSSTDTYSHDMPSDQQAGTAGQDSRMQGQSQTQSQTGQTAMTREGSAQDKEAKMALSPHTLMVHSSLESAKDQLNGLRSQMEVVENQQPSQTIVQHAKMYSQEINRDIKMVMTHENELQTSIKKYPQLAQAEEYKSLDTALSELKSYNDNWQSKMGRSDYWKNSSQVKTDLDNFEKRISEALDKSKSFNTARLDVSPTTG